MAPCSELNFGIKTTEVMYITGNMKALEVLFEETGDRI